jgi:hypothetical protein
LDYNGAVILSRENPPDFIDGDFYWSYPSIWSGTDTTETEMGRVWNEHSMLNGRDVYLSGVTPVQYSMDMSSLAFIRNRTEIDTYELMYYDGTNETHVADQVSIFVISDDGSTIAYLTRTNTANERGTLFTYDCSTGISTWIAEDAGTYFALSPNGSVIAYEKSDDEGKKSYFKTNEEEAQLVGEYISIISITDDASTIYFLSYSGDKPEFGAMHDGIVRSYFVGSYANFQDFGNALGYTAQLVFNKDHSQVLYMNGDLVYFAMNGGESIKVFDAEYLEVVGDTNRYDDSDVYTRVAYCTQKMFCYSKILDSKNLCNVLFELRNVSNERVAYFDENMEMHTLSNAYFSDAIVPGEGKEIIISLYEEQPQQCGFVFIEDYLDPDVEPVTLDKYIKSVEITSNQTIYFSNDVGQLFEIRDGVNTKIDTYAFVIDSVDINGTTYLYYLRDYDENNNYTLCCVEDRLGAEPIVIDTEVAGTYICSVGLLYYKNVIWYDAGLEAKDLYASSNGIDYSFIMTQVFMDR